MTLQRKILMAYSIGIVLLVNAISCVSAAVQPAPNPEKNTIVIKSSSGRSEILLAKHLTNIKAKVYTAYWCEHCYAQMSLFGAEAAQYLDRIECAPGGKNAQPELCREAKIEAFPTWIINGKRYVGSQPLGALSNVSGYHGPRQFKNLIP